jgi:hypothetical protein
MIVRSKGRSFARIGVLPSLAGGLGGYGVICTVKEDFLEGRSILTAFAGAAQLCASDKTS